MPKLKRSCAEQYGKGVTISDCLEYRAWKKAAVFPVVNICMYDFNCWEKSPGKPYVCAGAQCVSATEMDISPARVATFQAVATQDASMFSATPQPFATQWAP